MGTQSFGKGSVQTIMPLPGHGAIRLTTARYYTPAGTSIQAKGIVPDIEVRQSRIEVIEDADSRREADLRGRLENDQGAEGSTTGSDDDTSTGVASPTESEDYQLARALDLLRGIAMFGAQTVQ
jgi:carboxyl-terminal processing protease